MNANTSVRADERAAAPALSDLRRLHAFVIVAEERHFRRAAERLLITQSPLSRIIKALEHEIGAALFVRNRRRVDLTPAGEALLDGVRDVLARAQSAVVGAQLAASRDDASSETTL
jgi:DNA-binding transcriptional LysR family regulator